MEIYSLPSPTPMQDLLRQRMAGLIEAVGTQHFERRLFEASEHALGCEHFSVFSKLDRQKPRIFLAADHGAKQLARSVGSIYASRFWPNDLTNRLVLGNSELEQTVLVRFSDQERRNSQHRRSCYQDADWQSIGQHLIHKVSLVRLRGKDLYAVNLYRCERVGPFTDHDINALMNSGDLMFALLDRHVASSFTTDSTTLRIQFERCLLKGAPGLSPREVEVAAAIAVGLNSEAIGRTLGIGLNTVLTYRKRAYSQLGISSQNELIRLIYSLGLPS